MKKEPAVRTNVIIAMVAALAMVVGIFLILSNKQGEVKPEPPKTETNNFQKQEEIKFSPEVLRPQVSRTEEALNALGLSMTNVVRLSVN